MMTSLCYVLEVEEPFCRGEILSQKKRSQPGPSNLAEHQLIAARDLPRTALSHEEGHSAQRLALPTAIIHMLLSS